MNISLKDLLYTKSFLDPRFKAEYIPNGNVKKAYLKRDYNMLLKVKIIPVM